VAVVLPQKPENLLTHLACWKIGAISLPLSVLFGNDSLRYRIDDSGSNIVVADKSVIETVQAIRNDCPDLEHIVGVDINDRNNDISHTFKSVYEEMDEDYEIASTDVDTPAIIMYTSGSTGPPKGVLHTHSVWLGHCPAFYMYFELDVSNSVFWTPADWAWIGSLGDLIFPAWHYGRPIVGYPMEGFNATKAYEILEEYDITDVFLPPTAIRMMMEVKDPSSQYNLNLKAICSGGEPLTPEILEWAEEELDGVVVNELYGQTEANLLVTNCQQWFDAKPGSMGKPVPGHDVSIIDPETGTEKPVGEVGTIATRHDDDPVVFEEYWNQPEKTENAKINGWHLTGDLGFRDEDGYIWFKARDDDVIITSGYRVGPGEIESVILEHPDVIQVGVIGIPDERRNEIIKAYVEPAGDGGDKLRDEIRDLVRDRLAKYEYPREIEFIDELPQTTTGKIQRRKLREYESNS
jgi:acetyl-CoA synthetase